MSSRRALGEGASVGGEVSVFGQVMGLVAATLGALTLGAYLGRDLSAGASLLCFIIGIASIVGLNWTREAGGAAIALLLVTGLFLGLGLGGGLSALFEVDPQAVWQSAAATALFIAGLGAVGYATSSDLSGGYRVLFVLLLGLIVFGFVSLFAAIPNSNVIYAVLGLGIFGGYTVLDFNRMRSAGDNEAVSLACGIFLDILNVFTFFLQLFGRRGD